MCMCVYDFIAASWAPEIRTRETFETRKFQQRKDVINTSRNAIRIELLKYNHIPACRRLYTG